MKADAKVNKDMLVSRGVFDDSEKAHPIREEEFIKVERIKGKLLLIGAEDDVLWNTAKYIRRMEERLSRISHECEVESAIYNHATHFVFPEGLLKQMMPIGGSLFVGLFKAGRDFKKECKEARIDIDKRMSKAINDWIKM
ncbi:MAG: acyl-CoA thioester hydrolase, partial [Lachnospiraceae bacterium]|nr:acyl-CoA thioester hydrolase [Lachnospiraceae bacterium]